MLVAARKRFDTFRQVKRADHLRQQSLRHYNRCNMEQYKQRGMHDLVEHGHVGKQALMRIYRDNGRISNTDTSRNPARTKAMTMNECCSTSGRGVDNDDICRGLFIHLRAEEVLSVYKLNGIK